MCGVVELLPSNCVQTHHRYFHTIHTPVNKPCLAQSCICAESKQRAPKEMRIASLLTEPTRRLPGKRWPLKETELNALYASGNVCCIRLPFPTSAEPQGPCCTQVRAGSSVGTLKWISSSTCVRWCEKNSFFIRYVLYYLRSGSSNLQRIRHFEYVGIVFTKFPASQVGIYFMWMQGLHWVSDVSASSKDSVFKFVFSLNSMHKFRFT